MLADCAAPAPVEATPNTVGSPTKLVGALPNTCGSPIYRAMVFIESYRLMNRAPTSPRHYRALHTGYKTSSRQIYSYRTVEALANLWEPD